MAGQVVSAFTAKIFQTGQAPARLTLHGDKARPEAAQHIIEFPGGAIALTRLTDGSGYWAEITVNRQAPTPDVRGLHGARGLIEATRLSYAVGGGRVDEVETGHLVQLAALIRVQP